MLKHTLTALALAAALATAAQAQPVKYREGADYNVLPVAIADIQPGEIVEFFWYGCPHCYHMEPELQKWLANGIDPALKFTRVPAVTPNWAGGAQLYYTLRELGMDEKAMDEKIFDAFHKDNKRGIIFNRNLAITFLVENGAKQEDAEKAWDSLAVKEKMNRAKNLFEASRLSGVPGFVVDGKYVPHSSEDYARLFDELNTLASKPAADSKAAEAEKPAEAAKPAEDAKPAEAAKPAEEAKPAEAVKPAEETKPAS